MLELRDVEKRFGRVIALAGVSISVKAGEVHCLLGDNGAGKSTLIKTMSGVHPPTRGSILVNGAEITFGSARDAIRSGIATVFQDLAMIPLMSVTRNSLAVSPISGSARSGCSISTRPIASSRKRCSAWGSG
jgi:simple sugar transport system ATP-binding protein